MNRDYLRKVAFGIGVDESIPNDPLVWAQNQFDAVPDFIWEKKLPTLDEQRDRYGHICLFARLELVIFFPI